MSQRATPPRHHQHQHQHQHLRELGCVACGPLKEVGAGKEGWLVNATTQAAGGGGGGVLTGIDGDSLAFASTSTVVVVNWPSPNPVVIRLSKIEGGEAIIGSITAIEWIILEAPSRGRDGVEDRSSSSSVLALGTSKGFFLLYSKDARLIYKQMIHAARIIRIRVRAIDNNLVQDVSSEIELCLVMPGIIVRVDGSDIQGLLRRHFEKNHPNDWEGKLQNDSTSKLPFQLWNVGKVGPCVDAAITGVMPPPLLELKSRQRYYCAVTVGHDTAIAAFRLLEDQSRSLIGSIISKVVPATFSTLAKVIWRGSHEAIPTEVKPQAFARASVLTCLKDHPRKGERFALSPSGTLAAITDSLGRILLLDTQALVVVRLWKGYRDACCFFVEMPVVGDNSSSTSFLKTKHDYCLCLAIHAPRKEIVEVWKMRIGPRVMAIPCSKGSKILQPPPTFKSPTSNGYSPLQVYLLNGDSGQLYLLNQSMPSNRSS